MAKKRDYKAEYQKRIQHGLTRGLSRSEARGHGQSASTISTPLTKAFTYDRQLELGLKSMRGGQSLSQAAKSIHVAPERLRQYIQAAGVAQKKSGRWQVIKDSRQRVVSIFSKGKSQEITVNFSESQKVGSYMSAVSNFLSTNDPAVLKPFVGEYVFDLNGKRYLLETRPNVLYRLNAAQTETFEEVYRIVT